ncbi:DMT family transporter [Canibacter sp. lx-45]|uniref:DMT family transporter n=1 Tax=Canibacter zhuwentaonis TaxID=2837491 RepID=UPI001BDD3156|nr:DMT family transporter [Canibacter zhuwentaonis]
MYHIQILKLIDIVPAGIPTDKLLTGVALALAGAILMAFGLQYQSRGVNKMERVTSSEVATGLSMGQISQLLRRPSWLFGTLSLGAAVILQLTALTFAPLIVVQPLGIMSLVIIVFLSANRLKIKLDKRVFAAVGLCFLGIVAFVLVAASNAAETEINQTQLIIVLALFIVVAGGFAVTIRLKRDNPSQLIYIIAAGVNYGFVVTFSKTLIVRITQGDFSFLSIITIVMVIIGFLLAMGYVQNAHSCGPPDLVVAGLTVVDPLVAVTIGIVVLQEAKHAALWVLVVFIVAGAAAVNGVFKLAKYHPESQQKLEEAVEKVAEAAEKAAEK